MSRLRWGVLSTSTVATGKALPAISLCANAQVAAVASRDIAKAEAVASHFSIPKAYGSYDSLLQDENVDAVYIALPNNMHYEWTLRAVSAGKHVLCEKPASLSAGEVEEMVLAGHTANLRFMEGFMYRFHPQFDCVKRWLGEGRIGPLRTIRISFSFTLERRHSKIRLQAALGGGALADVGSYGVDLSNLLIGVPPIRVFATGTQRQQADVETSCTGIIEYPLGVHTLLDCGFDSPRHNRCEIVGELGTVTISSPFLATADATVRLEAESEEECITFGAVDVFRRQFEYFSAQVLGGHQRGPCDGDPALNARVLEALRSSVRTGRPVGLPLSTPAAIGKSDPNFRTPHDSE